MITAEQLIARLEARQTEYPDQALEVAIDLLQRMRRNIAARSMLAGWLADDQWRELEWDT